MPSENQLWHLLHHHSFQNNILFHNSRVALSDYRQLRNRGVTVRNTIDTLIATRCIIDDMPLLFRDRDFDPFVQHCGLVSAMDV